MNWITIGYVEGNGTTTERSDYSFTDKSPVNGVSYYRLKQIDFDGTFKILNAEMVEFSFVKEYSLEQNYPNPFNPSTVINYSIPVDGNVELIVYNILGSEVAVLVNEYKEAGNYSVEFSTGDKAGDLAIEDPPLEEILRTMFGKSREARDNGNVTVAGTRGGEAT